MASKSNNVGQVSVSRPISVDKSTYLNSLTTSITGYWWSSSKNTSDEREPILSCKFENYYVNNELRNCLIIIYSNGYQIWDCTSLKNIFEIHSKRTKSEIETITLINPAQNENSKEYRFYKNRPILAVIQKPTPEKKVKVKFISLTSSKFVPMTLGFRIRKIISNQDIICLVSDKFITLLNALTLKTRNIMDKQGIPCYPNGAVTLGSRWLVFATLQKPDNIIDEPTTSMDVAKNVGNTVAKSLVSTYSIIQSYVREDIPVVSNSTEDNNKKKLEEQAGSFAIYDIIQDKIIYTLKCHKDPISFLTFDPSGTILCTASTSGNYINVIKFSKSIIITDSGNKEEKITAKLIYRLFRGVSNATITNITFSRNSKWISVSSAKGTSHIFAINPDGSPVTTRTHPPLGENIPQQITDITEQDTDYKTQTLYALNKIYSSNSGISTEGIYKNFGCSFTFGDSQKFLIAKTNGILVQYQLQPMRTLDSENNAVLSLSILPEQEWDINRKLNMMEVENISSITNNDLLNNDNQWASFSENITFDEQYLKNKKVMITQRVALFHFKAFDEDGQQDLAESVLMTHPVQHKRPYRSPIAPYVSSNNSNSVPQNLSQSNNLPKDNYVSSLRQAMNTKLNKPIRSPNNINANHNHNQNPKPNEPISPNINNNPNLNLLQNLPINQQQGNNNHIRVNRFRDNIPQNPILQEERNKEPQINPNINNIDNNSDDDDNLIINAPLRRLNRNISNTIEIENEEDIFA